MPALLTLESARQWLNPKIQDPKQIESLLAPVEPPLTIYKVSARVNKPVNDDPQLIEPADSAE